MSPPVTLVRLAKSGGVVTRSPPVRKDARSQRAQEYFYGPAASLSPSSTTVALTDLQVFRVGGGPRAPSSALPMGAAAAADPLRVGRVPINHELVNTLLAVTHAQSPDQLLSLNVAGFVLITAVDMARGTVTYLSPCTGSLPSRLMLAGSLKVFLQ